jgi:hypothetical protein
MRKPALWGRIPAWWGLILILVAALALALAACDGDEDQPDDEVDEVVEPDATEEVREGFELLPFEPGLKMQKGLTMLNYSLGDYQGTAYFYGEVRNDTGERLGRAESLIYALDELNYEVGSYMADPLVTEIPPGQVFYVGKEFPAPEGFMDAQVWVTYLPGEPQFDSFFDLPATVSYHGPTTGMAYVVRGTVENNTARALLFNVVDVVLIGPDDNLVGLSRGILSTSAGDGTFPAGEIASFEAPFFFVAADPETVTDVRLGTAGYAYPEDSE